MRIDTARCYRDDREAIDEMVGFELRGRERILSRRGLVRSLLVSAVFTALGARGAEPLDRAPVSTLFVPIVISAAGKPPAFYTSEITLTNKGSVAATLELLYTPALEGGSPTLAVDLIGPGSQVVHPDAIAYLRSRHAAIPETGNRGGTLLVRVFFAASPADVAVTVRTTSEVPNGRAGLAYSGFAQGVGLTEPSHIAGLRQTPTDRSNLALQNVGDRGAVTLRVTLISGDPANPGVKVLPDKVLAPGGFFQWNEVLKELSPEATNGFALVQRVTGESRYYAYGVINDEQNGDGSFVPPVPESLYRNRTLLVLPAAVEAGAFITEVVVTNTDGDVARNLTFEFVSDAVTTSDRTARFTLKVEPGQQLLIPDFVQYLRERNVEGIGPKGSATFVGAVFVTVEGGTADAKGIVVGERVFSAAPPPVRSRTPLAGDGGRYGLFTLATARGLNFDAKAWVYGLKQDAENRSNLAIVNTGETDATTDVFRIDFFDGTTGSLAGTVDDVSVAPRRFVQKNTVLVDGAPGSTNAYALITRKSGSNPFFAYAALNDGAGPGDRSGDGAFLAGTRDCVYQVPSASRSFGSAGGAASVTVAAPAGCAWLAASDADWVELTANAAGSGTLPVSFSVKPNLTGSPRTTTLTAAGVAIMISQAANAASPYDGTWTGTTSQSLPITFRIENGEMTFLSIDVDVLVGGVCRITATLSANIVNQRPFVNGNQISGQVNLAAPTNAGATMNFAGTFSSPNAISGTYSLPIAVTDRGAICFGTNSFTFTGTRP